jgi:hypothetical protein
LKENLSLQNKDVDTQGFFALENILTPCVLAGESSNIKNVSI